ncbi:MBL fold metallo-hydrolase [Haladaptatus caseinilyticus]|uniref:MBL fold metallo-hydrolase n=1 Tax=Haladaptatus caseinilyticus TaxID=2993314 RepID=UPI00224AF9AE|nr:MBL fold metallo-hydrolase [Haladaptatus caseinilyticus]
MQVRVLGTAQDEGIPRLDCECNQCTTGIVRHGPAITVESGDETVLVDAPPDVKRTVGVSTVDSVILTHAHIGHYGGLFYFGREGYNTDHKPVYCSEKMDAWLRDGNKAYRHLIERGNVELRPFVPGKSFEIAEIQCHPIPVPHRNEDADTVGLRFEGEDASMTYIPDIDYWSPETERAVKKSDVALVDGTFFSMDEVGRRDVPHPMIPETMDRFDDCDTELYFTHLNHTNPAADSTTSAYRTVIKRGFDVADDGYVIELGCV